MKLRSLGVKGLRRLRVAVAAAVLAVIVVSVCLTGDEATLCQWCPLGLAQASLAARAPLPGLLLSVVIFVGIGILVGRAFCSWGCPSNLVKKASPASKCSCGSSSKVPLVVAGAALLISFVVGFPVFCLFCPIGLVFGLVFAVFKTLTIYQPSWDLVIFPLMLFAELRLFRSWCSAICPLGAVAGLLGRLNPRRALSVKAVPNRCRSNEGCATCGACCQDELAAPVAQVGKSPSCSACFECVAACPSEALKPVLFEGRKKEEEKKLEGTEEMQTEERI